MVFVQGVGWLGMVSVWATASTRSMPVRPLLFLLCSLFSMAAQAGMLVADGLLRTVGVDRSEVRLTVIPEFSAPYPVQHSSGRFDLELPYHAHYVLRAEAPGCATKEVVFNVNLPVRLNGLERTFALEILMERMAEGATFQYAGPVGLVFFDGAKEEFVHTTDHSRIYENSAVVLALHKSEGFADDGRWAASATLVAQPVGDPLAARLPQLQLGQVLSSDAPASVAGQRTIRVVGETPYIASVIDPEPSPAAVEPTPVKATHVTDVISISTTAAPSPPVSEDKTVIPVSTRLEAPASSGSTKQIQALEQHNAPRPDATFSQCGTTESSWIGRCLITVDRLPTGTGCTELRKAEHTYGAVFYFHDGRSITEHHYKQLMGGSGRK
jgi:hypothetical protein